MTLGLSGVAGAGAEPGARGPAGEAGGIPGRGEGQRTVPTESFARLRPERLLHREPRGAAQVFHKAFHLPSGQAAGCSSPAPRYSTATLPCSAGVAWGGGRGRGLAGRRRPGLRGPCGAAHGCREVTPGEAPNCAFSASSWRAALACVDLMEKSPFRWAAVFLFA